MKSIFAFIVTLLNLCFLRITVADDKQAIQNTNITGLSTDYLLQMLFGLIVVISCIFLFIWILKRSNQFGIGAQKSLKVITGVSLGTRERAVLVQVGEEQLLLGVTPNNVTLLHKLNTPLSIETNQSEFGKKFNQLLKSRDKL